MPLKRGLYFILLFCVLGIFSFAQLRFKQIDVSQGLSQNSVNKVFKDSEGYYWIGTQDGLNRYDGFTFDVYRHNRNDTNSLSDNFVLDIAEDKFGNLWIATRNGLNRYNKRTNLFLNVTRHLYDVMHAGHNSVFKLEIDKQGNLFYTVIGKLFYIPVKELQKPQPKSIELMILNDGSFAIDEADNLHVAADGSYYVCPTNKAANILAGKKFTDSIIAKQNLLKVYYFNHSVYIISAGVLFSVDEKNERFVELFESDLSQKTVCSVYLDSKNKLWIATDKGLFIADLVSNKLTKVNYALEYPYALRSEYLISLSSTTDSLLWIGSSGNGVFVYDELNTGFNFVNRYSHPELNSDNFSSVCLHQTKIYAGTSKGVAVFGEQFNLLNQYLSEDAVSDVAVGTDGNIWAATSNGLVKLNSSGKLVKRLNSSNSIFASNKLFSLTYVSDKEIWLSTEKGLYKYNSEIDKLEWLKCNSYQGNGFYGYILSASIGRDKRLWVCHSFGVSVFNTDFKYYKNFQHANHPDSLSHRLPTVFYQDTKNRKWIGTLGGGLNNLNEEKGNFRSFSISEGICSDFVTSIVEDKTGNLWLGTNDGICCFNPENLKFQNYNTSDGLIGNEISWDGMQFISDNKLVAASTNGLNVLNINKISSIPSLNKPIVKQLLINNETSIGATDSLVLENNVNRIFLECAYPDLRHKNNIQYEYKLAGSDDKYIRLPVGQKTIYITNLSFGKYLLFVRVVDNKERAYSQDLVLKIDVVPPFWKTKLFYALVILIVIGILALSIIYLLNRKHKQQLKKIEIEHKVYLERERISRDLHDNIGSQLTYIISNLDYLKYKLENEPNANHSQVISDLGVYARNTVQQLRDTIWAISGEKITVDEFSHRVKSYLVNFLSLQKDIQFSMNVNGKADQALSPFQLLNIFRVIQEAVNNIVKHANANLIEISFDCSSSEIKIVISDNGQGFAERKTENYGLNNMEYRVKNMNGVISIDSKPNQGTKITLICPLDLND
ncbi:MAG: hypothetical protein KA163_14700 [Bacteroidia bacterium]|nr:hypothetical protein [Bacteroidia bacterium]